MGLNFTTPSGKSGDPSVLYKATPAGELTDRHDNIRKNIGRNYPLVTPQSAERYSDVMKLVCFGPSLEETWPLLKEGEGDIWTISGANKYLFERGINPRFHLEADPRPHKPKLLEDSCPMTTYLIASRCHPDMFETLKMKKVLLFHISGGQEDSVIDELQPGAFKVPPAWTMGITALNVGLLLGYRKFKIWGMDGSFINAKQHPGEHPNEYPVLQKFVVNPGEDTEREFISHPNHIIASECFIKVMQYWPYGTFEFVGDGLIPYMYHCYTKDYR